jgi:hypothetical protein
MIPTPSQVNIPATNETPTTRRLGFHQQAVAPPTPTPTEVIVNDYPVPELAAIAGGFAKPDLADLASAREFSRQTAAQLPAYDSNRKLSALRQVAAVSESTGLRIGVIAETSARETRVSASPKTVDRLRGLGYDVEAIDVGGVDLVPC